MPNLVYKIVVSCYDFKALILNYMAGIEPGGSIYAIFNKYILKWILNLNIKLNVNRNIKVDNILDIRFDFNERTL